MGNVLLALLIGIVKLGHAMKEALLTLLDSLGQAYWVEVHTEYPKCTYYFGPFLSAEEASTLHTGYCEDLDGEGAQGISATVKRCKPKNLTIAEDFGGGASLPPTASPAFSS